MTVLMTEQCRACGGTGQITPPSPWWARLWLVSVLGLSALGVYINTRPDAPIAPWSWGPRVRCVMKKPGSSIHGDLGLLTNSAELAPSYQRVDAGCDDCGPSKHPWLFPPFALGFGLYVLGNLLAGCAWGAVWAGRRLVAATNFIAAFAFMVGGGGLMLFGFWWLR